VVTRLKASLTACLRFSMVWQRYCAAVSFRKPQSDVLHDDGSGHRGGQSNGAGSTGDSRSIQRSLKTSLRYFLTASV
jgi:hypothetical protein